MKSKTLSDINSVIADFYHILSTSLSHYEALKKISDLSVYYFGDYITPGSFNLRDEIYINLFELLDQLIFELSEIRQENNQVRDYVIEDIYTRLSIILEAIVSPEKYRKNLPNRPLRYEDTIIIKNSGMSEFVQFLIQEQDEWLNLEKNIVKTLLYFTDFVHTDYFYNIFKETNSGFLKAASLLGLKYCEDRGLNWKVLASCAGREYGQLLRYAERFDTAFISSNVLPSYKEEITFAVLHAEKYASLFRSNDDILWILSLADAVAQASFENSWFNEVNISMCNILLKVDISGLREILKRDSIVLKTIKYLDYLPRNLFNRITGILEHLGEEFFFTLKRITNDVRRFEDPYNSNIISFITSKNYELI